MLLIMETCLYLPLLFIPLGSVGSASCVTAPSRNNKKDGEMFQNGEGQRSMYKRVMERGVELSLEVASVC